MLLGLEESEDETEALGVAEGDDEGLVEGEVDCDADGVLLSEELGLDETDAEGDDD